MYVSVPVISKVHDAYIIAVEENARRKLEDVSANHKVVPVDMTKGPPLTQPLDIDKTKEVTSVNKTIPDSCIVSKQKKNQQNLAVESGDFPSDFSLANGSPSSPLASPQSKESSVQNGLKKPLKKPPPVLPKPVLHKKSGYYSQEKSGYSNPNS